MQTIALINQKGGVGKTTPKKMNLPAASCGVSRGNNFYSETPAFSQTLPLVR